MTKDEADKLLDQADDQAIQFVNGLLNLDLCPHCLAELIGRMLGSYAYARADQDFSPEELIGIAICEAAGFLQFSYQQKAKEEPAAAPEAEPAKLTTNKRMH